MDVNEIKNRKSTEKINKAKSWFLEKNKLYKPLRKNKKRKDTNFFIVNEREHYYRFYRHEKDYKKL